MKDDTSSFSDKGSLAFAPSVSSMEFARRGKNRDSAVNLIETSEPRKNDGSGKRRI